MPQNASISATKKAYSSISNATRASTGSSSQTHGAARIRWISGSGTRSSPIFLLSLSTNTGRAGSSRRERVPQRDVECFCVGCALPGTSPSTEPRWLAIDSRSSTWPPFAAIAPSRRLLPEPVGPQTTRQSKRVGSLLERRDDGTPELAVAALEDVDAKADLAEHRRERAAALAAAPAVDERQASRAAACRMHVALDVRRDVARHERRAALARRERRDLLCTRCRSTARSASFERRPVDGAGHAVLGELALGPARR